jgi:glucose/arabinose dehydrogenase
MKVLKYVLGLMVILAVIAFALLNFYSINPPISISDKPYDGEIPLNKVKLPNGFAIDVWAEDVDNARSMCYSPEGTLYVGTRSKGNVYALQDTNADGRADKRWTILSGGNMPNGVAFKDGDLYIAEVNRILKYEGIESKLDDPGEPIVVYDQYPEETHHGWKYIAFGPDGKLYVPVGAPCNICKSEDEVFASITRMNPDGTGMEVVQHGVRNTVGFDWHPVTGELWFTDNGRDWLGDEEPECELNRANSDGMHFGYPYCHQGDILDPEFGEGKACEDYTPPVAKMGPHTAPLGMEFYTGAQFPGAFKNKIFVARHGSWNRKKKIGYDVVLVSVNDKGEATGRTTFATGWLDDSTDDVWGRPVDIELLPDGTMLISDDYADVIYRVYYKGA